MLIIRDRLHSVLLCVCEGGGSPVVSVCVCRRLLYALVELGDQQAVVCVDRVTQVLAPFLLLCRLLIRVQIKPLSFI